jgi:alkanesulfonate monooxygenase SsuD/methylene tetrahydromethanopterin reductase-like flavin-dependent oxidoreductase (luciferase family)
VAKSIATAAVLSDHRVIFGVGTGWMREEFSASDQAFSTRGKRLDELLGMLPKIWTGDWVEHHGEFYDLPPFRMAPAPRKPIPVWVGGESDRAMRRAARADGWVGTIYDFQAGRRHLDRLAKFRSEAGTDDRVDYEICFQQPTVASVDDLRRWQELGVTSMWVRPWTAHHPFLADPGHDELMRSIEDYAQRVLSKLDRPTPS